MKVSADGGTPELIRPFRRDSGEQALGFPQVLRDGRILHSLSRMGPTPVRTEVFDPESDESRIVLVGGVGLRYLPSGHLVYSQARVVQVAGFDLEQLEVTTPAVPVPDDLYITILGTPLFSVSDGGTLIYLPDGVAVRTDLNAGTGRLVRVTREGRETTLQDDWAGFGRPRLSPDARRAVDYVPAGATDATSNFHVWVFDLERGTGQPLTTEKTNIFPLWTPDGRRVVFSSTQAGQMDLFWAPADGRTPAEPLLIREGEQFASSWSPDGGLLAFYERDPATRMDIWLLRMDDGPEAQPFLQTPANEVDPAFSPAGRWIAYASDASGQYDVYIRPFMGPGGPVRVSTTGGRRPRWALDGRELYYREGDRMWAVPVQTQPTLEVGEPKPLFEGPYASDYDIDPNGPAFVMVRIDPPTEPSRFHVVLNWFAELERLVGNER